MPRFRKLSSGEIAVLEQPTLGARIQVAREYDAYVVDYAPGDYGQVELAAGERRAVVRRRLQAAARRRGLTLRFRPGPSVALIFHAEAAPPVERPVPRPPLEANQRRNEAAQDRAWSPHPPRRRQTAAERYHEMLPRWMRIGQPSIRRAGSRRRAR